MIRIRIIFMFPNAQYCMIQIAPLYRVMSTDTLQALSVTTTKI